MKLIRSRLSLMLVLFSLLSCGESDYTIYVSPNGINTQEGTQDFPLQTIDRALEMAMDIRADKKGKISIYLKEGEYHLSAPLVIPNVLSDLAIIGEGTEKVSVKGSKVLQTNWKAFDEHIFFTELSEAIDFSQLFINGKKQILARYPNYNENGGAWQGHAADAISKERVSTWTNPAGGFVHAMHRGRWGGFHYLITGVDAEGELILSGGHQNNRPSSMHP